MRIGNLSSLRLLFPVCARQVGLARAVVLVAPPPVASSDLGADRWQRHRPWVPAASICTAASGRTQQITAWEAAVPRRRQRAFKQWAGGRSNSVAAQALSVPVLGVGGQCSKTAYRQHAPAQIRRAAAVADGGHVLRLRRPCSCRASKRMREDGMNDARLRPRSIPGLFLRYTEAQTSSSRRGLETLGARHAAKRD